MEIILTKKEKEILNTNLSAEIMKLEFHYASRIADDDIPIRLQILYNLRDKLCK